MTSLTLTSKATILDFRLQSGTWQSSVCLLEALVHFLPSIARICLMKIVNEHMLINFSPFPLKHFKICSFALCLYFKNVCGKNTQCRNNAICQSGFTDKGYRCLCNPGFQGEHCEGTHVYVYVYVYEPSPA